MGAERQIYRFLSEQVFDRQPVAVQSFLLDSALLDELTPERCDTMLGRTDSLLQIEALLRHHVFIAEVKHGVLRYHPLFREFLQEHYRMLEPIRYRAMVRRLAEAYVGQSQWARAFDMYVAAGDLAGARQVVDAGGPGLIATGRLETLERWFAALPNEELSISLRCLKARMLLDRGRHHEAQIQAELAAAQAQPDEAPRVQLLQSQIARVAGRYEEALVLAQGVLSATDDQAQRATALRTMAICHHWSAQTAVAIDEIQEALAIERHRGDLHSVALLQYDLGVCYKAIGQLRVAEEYYSLADAYWAEIGNAGLRALSINNKGVVQHLAGRYREAHATLSTAIQYASDGLVPQYKATALASLGDVYSDLNLWQLAGAMYAEARQVGGTAYLMSYLDVAGLRLLVRQRQYAAAAQALQQLPEEGLQQHTVAVLLIRASIAAGLGRYGEAMQHAQRAAAAAKRAKAPLDLARAYLLQAQLAAMQEPIDVTLLQALLDSTAQTADQIGHDAFLVAEVHNWPALLRRASAIGWPRADDWRRRRDELQLTAQMIEHDDMRPVVTVQAFGADQIMVNGQVVDLGWLKAREVFYYLLAHPGGAATDALREAIWPDLDTEGSRGALKSAVFRLRAVLPRELIVLRGRQVYQIDREAAWIDYDVEQFLQLLDVRAPADDPEPLFEAFHRYQGEYLPWSESAWSRDLRMQLEQRYLNAMRHAATHAEQAGAYADALMLYQRILAIDTLDEAAHAGVMRCQIGLGNRAAAIEQYRVLSRVLHEELGLAPARASEAERLYIELLHA
jgi:ATP/maltotriose-dependent transcriptional regulator MalT/DNA-binding SARP family transcriptional activator